MILRLSLKSIWNRKLTTILTVILIALSTFLILGVERIRTGAKRGFESTISGTDLIVGPRSSPVQLLFYSVFGIGNPTNNVSWESYEKFANHPEVRAAVPISLGDSHKGFRVIGTTPEYFGFYKYGKQRSLEFSRGRGFNRSFEAVIGSEVEETLQYDLSTQITLSHGTGEISFQQHTKHPFTIAGILKHTGTPVDRNIFVSLDSMDALHEGLQQEREISAFFLKLQSRIGIFSLQREINEHQGEALTAILPGMALKELWGVMRIMERALMIMSVITYAVSLVGMVMVFLTTLNERRREMAILRSVGAPPSFLSSMLLFEAGLLASAGIAIAFLSLNCFLLLGGQFLEDRLGLSLTFFLPASGDLIYVSLAIISALIAALFPAWRAYRNTLSDGLTVRT